MIAFALLTIGAVLAAVGAGIHILKREYLPLLQELLRSHPWEDAAGQPLWREEEEP